jgi:hypothetical protein
VTWKENARELFKKKGVLCAVLLLGSMAHLVLKLGRPHLMGSTPAVRLPLANFGYLQVIKYKHLQI